MLQNFENTISKIEDVSNSGYLTSEGNPIKEKINKMKIYKEGLNEIDTFNSYFNKVLIKNDQLCIPYINLGISEHPLNPKTNTLKYINLCYLIFDDITFLKVNNDSVLINENVNFDSIYLGGINIDTDSKLTGLEIKAENAFLQLDQESLIQDEMWIPRDSPNYRRNMDDRAINFLLNPKLPSNLALKFENSEFLAI